MARPIGHTVRETLGSWWFIAAVFCVALILLVSIGRVFVRRTSFQREIAALQAEKEQLIVDNEQARRQLTYLSTEAFLEEEAREKFGQKRPGETSVYIAEGETGAGERADERVRSNPELWWRYFFDPKREGATISAEDAAAATDAATDAALVPTSDRDVWIP